MFTYFHLVIALTLILAAIAFYFIFAYLDKPEITCPIMRANYKQKRQIGYILLVVAAVILGVVLYFRKRLTILKRQIGQQPGEPYCVDNYGNKTDALNMGNNNWVCRPDTGRLVFN